MVRVSRSFDLQLEATECRVSAEFGTSAQRCKNGEGCLDMG